MYKNKNNYHFHIFTDGKDEWTSTKADAIKLLRGWKSEGYRNLRIWTTAWNVEDGVCDDVDCIFSHGTFPY